MPISIFGVFKRSLVWLVLWIGGGNLLAYAIYQSGASCYIHLEVLIILCCTAAFTVGAVLQQFYFRKMLRLDDKQCRGDKRTFELDINAAVISCSLAFVLSLVDGSRLFQNMTLVVIIVGTINIALLTTIGRRAIFYVRIYLVSASIDYKIREPLIICEGIILTALIYLSGLLMPIKYLF